MSRVYVGRISYKVREKDVERFFRGFGRIRDINLKNGFGFVEFDDPRDADDAVYECNGRELLGERLVVEHARGSGGYRGGGRGGGGWGGRGGGRYENKGFGPPTRTEHRLHVENISSRVSWQDLKDFMRQAGDITYADAHRSRAGEGTVEYATRDDMKNALKKLDGADLNGRKLRLTEMRSRYRSRSRSRSRGRSRSGSKSRSRSRDKDRSRSRSKSPREDKEKERSRSRSRSRENSESRRSHSRSPAPATADGEGGDREREDRPSRSSRSRSRSPENNRPRSTSPDKEGSPGPAQEQEMSASPTKEDGPEE